MSTFPAPIIAYAENMRLICSLFLGLMMWAPLTRMQVRKLAEIVDGRYDSLSSLRAHFVEIYSQSGERKV